MAAHYPALRKLIDERKQEHFTDPSKASDAEALGVIISVFFEWDGIQILEAFEAALEDANFHTEAGLVSDMLTRVRAE